MFGIEWDTCPYVKYKLWQTQYDFSLLGFISVQRAEIQDSKCISANNVVCFLVSEVQF